MNSVEEAEAYAREVERRASGLHYASEEEDDDDDDDDSESDY